MCTFWVRVSLASILVVCSSSFNGYGQYRLKHKDASEDHDDPGHDDEYGNYPPHYAYGYSVHGNDPYGGPGPRYDKSETMAGMTTEGGYSVDLPDGRTQIVTYTVRGNEGFVANVIYKPTQVE